MWRLKLYRGKWYAVGRDQGNTVRISLRTADREVAAERLKRLEHEREKSRSREGTIGELVAAYLSDRADTRSHGNMVSASRAILRSLSDVPCGDPTLRTRVRAYIKNRRNSGVANGTIIKELGVLKAALRYAGHNPQIEQPPTPPSRTTYLTRPEFDRLLKAAKQPHIRLFCELAVCTAARSGAILELQWSQIHFDRGDRGAIDLGRSVGRKGRSVVPMPRRLRNALLEAQKAATCDYVIEWGGDRVRSIRKGFENACRAAGLEGITPHDLRRTAATWMAMEGVPMQEIAAYLGHSNPAITYKAYSVFSPEHLERAAKALD